MSDDNSQPDPGDIWSMLEASTSTGPLIIRRAIRYDHEREVRRALPVRINVTVAFDDTVGPLAPAISKLEAALEERSDRRAVLVLILTNSELKEFVLYCASGEWITGYRQHLRKEFPNIDVQVSAVPDPAWNLYMDFADSQPKLR